MADTQNAAASDNKELNEQGEDTENTEGENMAATLLYQGHGSVRIVTGEGKIILQPGEELMLRCFYFGLLSAELG